MKRRVLTKSVALLMICIFLHFPVMRAAGTDNAAILALEDSYAIGKTFNGQDKISYLVRLTLNSADIDNRFTHLRCEELFKLVSASPLDWAHVANQKNAAVPLAKIDSKRSMELLAQVAVPQPNKLGEFTEDVRADAAATIFPAFWHDYGEAGLSQLERQAQDIGDTGEYPYRAMAFIVNELAGSNQANAKTHAKAIFSTGLQYYKRYSKFQDEEEEFLDLLESGRHVVAEDVYREALDSFIKHVSVPKPASNGVFAADIGTASGIVRVTDQNRHLLFRVFPLLSEFDRTWAQRLSGKDLDLQKTTGGIQLLGAAVVRQPQTKEEAEQQIGQMLEKALLPRITELQATDPQAALQLVGSLQTRSVRVMAYAAAMPGIGRADKVAAFKMYAQELREIQEINDPIQRLQALVAAAQSAYYVGDLNNFTILSDQIFDRGIEFFENSTRRADVRPGYAEMTGIIEFAAAHNQTWIVERVQHVHNPLLKAYLLIFVAKGLNEAQQAATP